MDNDSDCKGVSQAGVEPATYRLGGRSCEDPSQAF